MTYLRMEHLCISASLFARLVQGWEEKYLLKDFLPSVKQQVFILCEFE